MSATDTALAQIAALGEASKARPWLNDRHRADLAKTFACEPCDVERCLDARERMETYIAERREYYGREGM